MRHLKHRFQLGRKKEHREALMANLAAALLRHGRIQTTLPKAKALRPFVEKVITLAKKAQGAPGERALHYRRQALARVRDKEAVALLFNERAEEFSSRGGGYTRIYKLGNRLGDAAEMAVIQLIAADDEGYAKKGRKSRKAVAAGAETSAPAPAADAAEEAVAETEEKPAEAAEVSGDPGEEEKKSS
jgi:large subunit ribosomal protein L17